MNQDLQNLEIKVENEGTTPQGRLTAAEWNILVAAVKSLDLTGGSADITSILQAVADAGYATQEWVTSQKYITSSTFDNLTKNLVTLDTTQAITGMKDFTNGLKIGGLSMYKSKGDTVYLDANLVVRGGVTAFGTNETITASIFEALPIDGATLKRTENGVLYVDTTVVGGGGGTGSGISIADVESYLTTNGYATQSWVTGRGYITSSALEPYALKTAIPTSLKNPNALSWSGYSSGSYDGSTAQSIALPTKLSQLTDDVFSGKVLALEIAKIGYGKANSWPLELFSTNSYTGIAFACSDGTAHLRFMGGSKWGVTAAGWTATYDLLHSGNYSEYAVKKNLDINTAIADNEYGYGYVDGGWPEAGPAMVFGAGIYKAGVHIGALGSAIRYGYTAGTTSFTWRTILDDNNYSDYALPLTGGKINGDLEVAGCLYSSGENLRIRPRGASLAGVEIALSDADYWQISHRGSFANNELHFYHNANGTWSNSVLSLSANGDVVTGNNLLAKGGITATNSSDERLKRNLRKFNASKVLMSLGGVYEYEYIDSEVQKNHIYEGTHYGLIYQHVKGTKLDVMCHEREDGMGALNYIHPKFISLIAGATMDNISEIEQVKRENRELRKELEQLKQRVA